MHRYADILNSALERVADLGFERAGGELANHAPMGRPIPRPASPRRNGRSPAWPRRA
ncbi:hypothetical protein AB0L13_01430 [Saccharopolyspora shandongensis]|uniref:hypothetical protein n=1 Tax=Saccharopolyspora shandongensis TaxID=418495 RepID=UPI003444F362